MRKQVWILALYSFALVTPKLLTTGMEIVTYTYQEGTFRYWSGLTPYMNPEHGDRFLYSPIFAILYSVFAWLPSKPQALAWAALNSFVFWSGISAWFRLERKTPWLTWVALIAASMELDGSLRYQQINALLVGMMLHALAAYRDSRFVLSATNFAFITNIKLLPIVFAAPLAFRKKYAVPFATISVLLVLIPGWKYYVEWYRFLTADVATRKLLDIATVMGKLGWPETGRVVWVIVAGVSGVLLLSSRFLFSKKFPWGEWISLGLTAMLVLSPRTESPTFVLLGPVYLFLAGRRERSARVALLASIFFVSVVYNSIWPRAWYFACQEGWLTKTLGALTLWTVSAGALAREMGSELAKRFSSSNSPSTLQRIPTSG